VPSIDGRISLKGRGSLGKPQGEAMAEGDGDGIGHVRRLGEA
jgi:hypothetical protein